MINSIKIRKLFGYHSYDINLNEGISVIFGSNALGKTTVAEIASGKTNLLADKVIISYDKPLNEVILRHGESAPEPEHAALITAKDILTWRNKLNPMTKEQFNLFKKLVESFYYEKDPSYKKIFLENEKVVIKAKSSLNSDWSVVLSYDNLSLGEQQLMMTLNQLLTTTKETVFLDGIDCFMHIGWQQKLYETFQQCIDFNPILKQVIIFTQSPFTTGGYDESVVGMELVSEKD